VKVTNPDHPITQGVKDFVVTDEQHYQSDHK
jgi:type 1 glutamine amidotransferase